MRLANGDCQAGRWAHAWVMGDLAEPIWKVNAEMRLCTAMGQIT
jgi:hypothetical protein